MEKGKIEKIYYLLVFVLVVVSLILVAILIKRADQADKFFEYQKSKSQVNNLLI